MSRLPRFGAQSPPEANQHAATHGRRLSRSIPPPTTPLRQQPQHAAIATAPAMLRARGGIPAPGSIRDTSPSRLPSSSIQSPRAAGAGAGRGTSLGPSGIRSINSSISSDTSGGIQGFGQGRDSGMSSATASSAMSRGIGRFQSGLKSAGSTVLAPGRSTGSFFPPVGDQGEAESELGERPLPLPSRQPSQSISSQFTVGDRVRVESMGLEGTLQFLGVAKFKPGIWAGIELDEQGTGKNDGSVAGIGYFSCPPQTGIFVLGSKLSRPESCSPAALEPHQNPNTAITRPGVGLRRPGNAAPQQAGAVRAGSNPQPGSRMGKFTTMTAQQYKRASLLMKEQEAETIKAQQTAPSTTPSSSQMQQRRSPPQPGAASMRGRGFSRSLSRPAVMDRAGAPPVPQMSHPTSMKMPGMEQQSMISPPISRNRMSVGHPQQQSPGGFVASRNQAPFADPEEFAKLQARLEVIEAENRLLKVRDQQQQAQLAASEMLDRGVVVEAQAALESSGEIAALRERVESLEKERVRLEAEKAELEDEVQEARRARRGSVMTSITGLEELGSNEQTLRLTEVIHARDRSIKDLESQLDMVGNGGEIHNLFQRIRDLEDALAESDLALSAKEDLENGLRQDIECLKSETVGGSGDSTWRERYEEIERQLEEKSIEMGQMAARLDRLSTEAEKEKAHLKETVARLKNAGQETITAYEQQIEDLRAQLESNGDEAAQASDQTENVALLSKEKRDLGDRVLLLEAERERLKIAGQETIEVYEVRVQQLKDELDWVRAEGTAERRPGTPDREGARLQIEAMREEIFAIKDAAAKNELSRVRLEKELELARIEATRSTADAAEALEVCEKLGADLETVRNERVMLKERIGELEGAAATVTGLSEADALLIEELKRAKDDAERRLQQILDEIDINKSVREMDEMVAKEEANRVRTELKQALEHNAQLEYRLESHAGGSSVEEVNQLRSQLSALAQRLADTERAKKLVESDKDIMEANLAELAEAHRNLENDCMHLMDEVERLHNDSMVSMQQLQAATASNASNAGAEGDVDEILQGLDTSDAKITEYVEQALRQQQSQMDARLQTYRDEVRRLQQRVTEIEREKMTMKARLEADVFKLEELIEQRIFNEADLEEREKMLEMRIESLKAQMRNAGITVEGEDPPPVPRSKQTDSDGDNSSARCELCDQRGHDLLSCPVLQSGEGSDNAAKSRHSGDGLEPLDQHDSVFDHDDDENDFDEVYCSNCEVRGDHYTEDCPNGDEECPIL